MDHNFATAEDVARFIRGGRAIVTIQSEKTGTHYTYKIVRKDDDKDGKTPFFVNLLTGPDNTANYTYMGVLDADAVRLTKKSAMTCEAASVKALNYVLKHVAAGQMPPSAKVRHEGRCGMCNRVLTHPDSLDRGIGPECWGKINGG